MSNLLHILYVYVPDFTYLPLLHGVSFSSDYTLEEDTRAESPASSGRENIETLSNPDRPPRPDIQDIRSQVAESTATNPVRTQSSTDTPSGGVADRPTEPPTPANADHEPSRSEVQLEVQAVQPSFVESPGDVPQRDPTPEPTVQSASEESGRSEPVTTSSRYYDDQQENRELRQSREASGSPPSHVDTGKQGL